MVATEVRKLAEKSRGSAQEIGEIASSSVDIAEEAGKLIDRMQPQIQRTADLIVDVASSSKQQRDGAEQISTGLQQMSQVSQQSASFAEELAATSEQLSGQADALTENLSYFQTATGDTLQADPGQNVAGKDTESVGRELAEKTVETFRRDQQGSPEREPAREELAAKSGWESDSKSKIPKGYEKF